MHFPSPIPERPRTPFLPMLRARTDAAHRDLDRMIGPLDSLEAYGRYLHGMDLFLATAAPHCRHERAGIEARRALLRLDQLDWGFRPRSDDGAPVMPGTAGEDEGYGLGWAYVVAGSTLGARVLLRSVTPRPFGAVGPHRFLHAHMSSDDWPRLVARLQAATGEQVERACTGAVDAFDAAHAAFAPQEESPWW